MNQRNAEKGLTFVRDSAGVMTSTSATLCSALRWRDRRHGPLRVHLFDEQALTRPRLEGDMEMMAQVATVQLRVAFYDFDIEQHVHTPTRALGDKTFRL